MTTDDAKEQAQALLATVKKKLTGREIAACEWTKSADYEDECQELFMEMSDDEFDPEEVVNMEEAHNFWTIIQRLSVEFSKEIGDWINKRNAARARATTKPTRK